MLSASRNWIRNHSLIVFLIFAFGYTWTYQISLAVFAPELAWKMNNLRLAVYGPTIAALIVPLIGFGPKELVDFLRRRLALKGSPLIYMAALLLIPALLLSLRGIHSLAFPDLPLEMPALRGQGFNILVGFLIALTYGPLAEELGWRGVAQPELQKHMDPLLASLVLGVIWWAWHLPSLLIPAFQWAVGGTPVLLYLAIILPGAVLAAWIYNHSRGSVLPVILFHGSMNFFMGLLGFNSPHFMLFVLAGLWMIAILVIILWGRALSRARNPLAAPAQEGIADMV